MKTSNSPSRGGLKIHSVCLVANPNKDNARRELLRLRAWFKSLGIRVVAADRFNQAQAVVTLGGDGTLLTMAPKAAQAGIPILGINLGHLGFLTTMGPYEIETHLLDWLKTGWQESHRTLLKVQIPRLKKTLLALNDAVLRVGSVTRMTRIRASIQNEALGFFTGDGVIVATSTGSTAYSLSAQGPVIHPSLEALVLTPICAHTFSQRPVVFPANQSLELVLDDDRAGTPVFLCLDGREVISLVRGDRVVMAGAEERLRLIFKPEISYFGILRDKLSWGVR